MSWWRENKDILVREKKRLDDYTNCNDFNFEIRDDYLWLVGTVFLDSESNYALSFECKYPQSYPFAPPSIYPKDKKTGWVDGHQFKSEGRFCLDIRDYNWNSSFSVVEIIESMRILVYASLDKYLRKKKKLDVKEGVEPTQLEIKTKEIRCLYTIDTDVFNKSIGVFNYFSFKELEDHRIIITPEFKGKKELLSYLTSELFNIWDFNIFYTKKGIFISINQALIESIIYCKNLKDLYSFFEKNNVIEEQGLLVLISENKSEYILLVNENNKPVLLAKPNSEKGTIQYFGCYGIDYSKLQERIPNKKDVEALTDKKITIIGCGSGGGAIAENMVKAGITKLILIDSEILETENIFRHNCTLKDIGLRKTYALKKRLLSINPQVSITVIDEKIESITENVHKHIKDSDIIINAIGNSENLINSYSYTQNIPTIHSKVYPWGFGGEIIRVIPSIHPCFECMNLQLNRLLDEVPKTSEFPLNKTIDYNIAIDGENIPIPSLAVDAAFIINIASKMAIETVLYSIDELKNKTSIILWGNKKEWIFEENFSCKKVDSRNFKSLSNCLVCNNREVVQAELSMDTTEIEKVYLTIIKEETNEENIV